MDCIFCNTGFEAGQEVHMCPACRSIYHAECWEALKSCFVCAKQTPAEAILAAQQPGEMQTVSFSTREVKAAAAAEDRASVVFRKPLQPPKSGDGPGRENPPSEPPAVPPPLAPVRPSVAQPSPAPPDAAGGVLPGPPPVQPSGEDTAAAEPSPYGGYPPGTARCLCGTMVPIAEGACAKCGRPHPAFRRPREETPDDYARLSRSDALVYFTASVFPGFIGAALFAGFVWLVRLGRFIGSPLAEQMSVGSTNIPKLGPIEGSAFLFGFVILTGLLFYMHLKKNAR
jgi:hypothetical protein